MMAEDGWPGQAVADSLAAIISTDRVVVEKDYDAGAVVVQTEDFREQLTPSEAHKLADGYADTLENRGLKGAMQTDEVIKELRHYADAVAPYREDAAEE